MNDFPNKAQRLILYNQYETLKIIDPTHSRDYEEKQEIISCGYEMAYDWFVDQVIWDPVPQTVCKSTLNALVVCDALEASQRVSGVTSDQFFATFRGFDGNNETEMLGFARLLIERQGKFSRFKGRDLNSHFPGSAAKYAKMHEEWERRGSKYNLSPEDVEAIVKA